MANTSAYVQNLLTNATATGVGAVIEKPKGGNPKRSFQMIATASSGNVSATADIQGSNDGTNFVVLATLTIASAATPQTEAAAFDIAYLFVRANLTAITGTAASVNLIMGQ